MAKDIQKWADPAMFKAEEQEHDGPQVQLLSCTPDPLGTIAATAHAYQGKFHASLAEITDDDRRYFLGDVRKNVLSAPLEFVHFHFRITGVTRGFTHQMVRQRTACYAQESTRFAVKENVPVALPPSLAGTLPWPVWWEKCGGELYPILMQQLNQKQIEQIDDYAERQASKEQLWRKLWDQHVASVDTVYNALVNSGMPAEDARGLLPTNLLTQLNYTTSLRHLIDHAGLRLCTQAQFEWRLVWVEILNAIRRYPIENNLQEQAWQFDIIADLFKPICYKTGACQFKSDFDRFCTIRDRVDYFAQHGIPSSEWPTAIKDEEWLADPKAARA